MRRGHPGACGWRGENMRPFRPRRSGTPNFRPPRVFRLLESPRFPPPGGPPRQYSGPRPYSQNPIRQENVPQSENHERNNYRGNILNHSLDRGYHNRGSPIRSFRHQSRQNEDHGDSYNESNFYQNTNQCHVNNMGDVDHRQNPILPWVNPPLGLDSNRQYYDNHRSPHKTRYQMGDDLPDYTGHRPPASDHYSTTTGPNNNNSQYSHSVNDTVDIVRKRLQNRDKQQNFDSSLDQQNNMDEDLRKNTNENYQNVPQEQPVRKKIQRQKQNNKSNCDKIKNKIVHQLFKMDKTKIHKLMDDPSSSTKFEYAISSLITEGQNSLNRHLRSAAEKSLCSSSTDFIQDDTNTIYEDTFMKQMQGVLDPQDTVLLEDIKPLVMAELRRCLQLDDYQFELMQDQGFQNLTTQDQDVHDQGMQNYVNENEVSTKEEPSDCQYYDEGQDRQQYSQDTFYNQNQAPDGGNNIEIIPTGNNRFYEYEGNSNIETQQLFERRPKKIDSSEKGKSLERRLSRSSIDESFGYVPEKSNEATNEQPPPIPMFDPNTEQLSDDDDPFAELDKQYHVAVDHNFIGNEYASRPTSPAYSCGGISRSPNETLVSKTSIEIPSVTTSNEVKQELDTQIQNMAQSSEKLFTSTGTTHKTEPKRKSDNKDKKNPEQVVEKENLSAPCDHAETPANHTPHEESSKSKETVKKPEKHQSHAPTKSILLSNTRKRSVDQKPSHRKEKRKRSSQSESQAKSTLSLFCPDVNSKDVSMASKKPDSTTQTYSNKYVKRKEPQKKRERESSKIDEVKKHGSNTSSHSNKSPKDNISNEIPSKSDHTKKLKPIDIFGTVPFKKGTTHQSHRNPATTPQIAKSPDDKPTPILPITTSFARKLSKKHVGTQVILNVKTREIQTSTPKIINRPSQTDPVVISKSASIATNPLERMKEIDMEIQLLLQEKFKLYNSLETKAATVPIDTIPSLSMRVFKVNTEQEESNDSEDAIVDDFANIPTEELEKIALETIEDVKNRDISTRKGRRQKVAELSRKSSASPIKRRNNRKAKSPNISLIEQIITDDRPIEDIISLDDLEITPAKSKKKYQRVPKKKSSKKTNPSKLALSSIPDYNIKECQVRLEPININEYLKPQIMVKQEPVAFPFDEIPPENNGRANEELTHTSDTIQELENQSIESGMVHMVEDAVNDLQFDMLDVSEDIVIEDSCELKTIDKVKETITEEIILDNSQSSVEDGAPETTGAESECKMYDYSNESLRRDATIVTGNADAVLAIECIDNDFIAACLDGNVYHFSGEGLLLNTLRGTNQAVTCLTIVKEKYGTTIYTGSLDSRMRYFDLETGLEKGPECNVLSPIQTMDRAWDTIFVGTRTGFVLQFECKNNMVIPVSTVKFSEQSILALRAMKEGPRKVLLVAARSENVVTIKDAQTGLLLRTLQGPKMTVYTLLYEDGKVYCGTSSQNIHVFDYTTGSHVGSHEGGKGAVCLRTSGGLVFAGCYDGCVYVYREGEARPRAQLRGPGLMLLSLAIHGTKIIAGYKDRGLYIWKMPLAIVQEMIL